jgi:hypothetical protein
LDANPSVLTIKVKPPAAQLEWRCGNGPAQQKNGTLVAQCAEDQFTVTARLQDYEEASKTWDDLTPGQRYDFDVELHRTDRPLQVKPKTVCGPGDLIRSGWKSEGNWFIASRPVPLPCVGFAGQFEFTVQVPKGLWAKPVQWTLRYGLPGAQVFQLEKKSFSGPALGRKDITEYYVDGTLKFRILIGSAQVAHFIWAGGSWLPIGVVDGDYREGKFIISKDARLKGFSFTEQ